MRKLLLLVAPILCPGLGGIALAQSPAKPVVATKAQQHNQATSNQATTEVAGKDAEVAIVSTDPGYEFLARGQLTDAWASESMYEKLPLTWKDPDWKACYEQAKSSRNSAREIGNLIAAYYDLTPAPENTPNARTDKGTRPAPRQTSNGVPLPWGFTPVGNGNLAPNCFLCHGGTNAAGVPDPRVPDYVVKQQDLLEDLVKVNSLAKLDPTMKPLQNNEVAGLIATGNASGRDLVVPNPYSNFAMTDALIANLTRDDAGELSFRHKLSAGARVLRGSIAFVPTVTMPIGIADQNYLYTSTVVPKTEANGIAGMHQFSVANTFTRKRIEELRKEKYPLAYRWASRLPSSPPSGELSDLARTGQGVYGRSRPGARSCASCHADLGNKYTSVDTDPEMSKLNKEFVNVYKRVDTTIPADTSSGYRAKPLRGLRFRTGLMHNASIPLSYFIPGCGAAPSQAKKDFDSYPDVWRVKGPNPKDPRVCAALREGTYRRPVPPEIETPEEVFDSKKAAELAATRQKLMKQKSPLYRSPYGREWYDSAGFGLSNKTNYHRQLIESLSAEKKKALCAYLLEQ